VQGVLLSAGCGSLLQAESHSAAHLGPVAEVALLVAHGLRLVLGLKDTCMGGAQNKGCETLSMRHFWITDKERNGPKQAVGVCEVRRVPLVFGFSLRCRLGSAHSSTMVVSPPVQWYLLCRASMAASAAVMCSYTMMPQPCAGQTARQVGFGVNV
jgi:hypothetical protein